MDAIYRTLQALDNSALIQTGSACSEMHRHSIRNNNGWCMHEDSQGNAETANSTIVHRTSSEGYEQEHLGSIMQDEKVKKSLEMTQGALRYEVLKSKGQSLDENDRTPQGKVSDTVRDMKGKRGFFEAGNINISARIHSSGSYQ